MRSHPGYQIAPSGESRGFKEDLQVSGMQSSPHGPSEKASSGVFSRRTFNYLHVKMIVAASCALIAACLTTCSAAPTLPLCQGDSATKFYNVSFVADLDKNSVSSGKNGNVIWLSKLVTAKLRVTPSNQSTVFVTTDEQITDLDTLYNYGGRGAELSDLIRFNNDLLTPDDKTGIIFKILKSSLVPWSIIGAGAGDQRRGQKNEWMTVRKDGKLVVGSHGSPEHWVAIVDKNGGVVHENWLHNYQQVKNTVGVPENGYITHEAVYWSPIHNKWFLLPRRISLTPYNEKEDPFKGSNTLISCSETFDKCNAVKIHQPLEPSLGYSAFKFLPGTNETLIIALKTKEFGDKYESYANVFTIDGIVFMKDTLLSTSLKFEGIEVSPITCDDVVTC